MRLRTVAKGYMVLAFLLLMSQCTSAPANTAPPHTYVSVLVMEIDRYNSRVVLEGFRTQAACEVTAAEQNARANSSTIRFRCVRLVVVKE